MIKKYKKFIEKLNNQVVEIHKPDFFDILPKEVKDLHKTFNKAGLKMFLVGGAVRDFLMGKEPKDYDIVTNTDPDVTIDMVNNSDKFELAVDGTVGKRFGVIIVKHKDNIGDSMEIAATRVDVTKGRNPKVKLGVSLEQDAQRRDLKINSLYYDLDSKNILDFTGGLDAVQNNKATFVGDITERIKEDPLRILRYCRFMATIGDNPSREEIKAIKSNNKLEMELDGETQRVSQEAIWVEFEKAWNKAKDFKDYINFLTLFDMWNEVFPSVTINTDIKPTKSFNIMLAQLFSNIEVKNIRNFLVNELKFPDKPGSKTASIVDFLLRLRNFTKDDVFVFEKEMKRLPIVDKDIIEFYNIFNLKQKHFKAFLKYKPVADTKELIKKGFKGKELGEEINRINKEAFLKILN
jgi:poly(A) polymerase